MYSLLSMGYKKFMENRCRNEYPRFESVFLSYFPGLSINLPLVAMARRKSLHSCLVQLLLPSLLSQLPSAQAELRLLRFSVSTWSFWWGYSTGEPLEHRIHAGQRTKAQLQPSIPHCAGAKLSSQQTGCQKAAAKVGNSRFSLVTAPSFSKGASQPPPPIPTHLLTGIWHKGAVNAEAWKHLLLLFQRVRLGKAVQEQFCSKRKRRETVPVFPSMPPCSNHSSAINTQSLFSNIYWTSILVPAEPNTQLCHVEATASTVTQGNWAKRGQIVQQYAK